MAKDIFKSASNKLNGAIAFVTGTARPRGIGSCVAKLLAYEGAKVILTDISDEVWERVQSLNNEGLSAIGYQADLRNLSEVKEIVGRVINKYSRIDILVNVAGKSVPPRPSFLEMTEAYWNIVMDRNLKTALNCCWAIIPHMIERRYGRVINFSSITGPKVVYRYSTAYAASKGAISAFTRALALEIGEHNITVNAILPGDIDTEDSPWGSENGRRDLGILNNHLSCPIPRPGKSEEVANLVLFLASEEAGFITGTEITIDGGATIVEPFPSGPA